MSDTHLPPGQQDNIIQYKLQQQNQYESSVTLKFLKKSMRLYYNYFVRIRTGSVNTLTLYKR